jgi:hypothetical protein
MAELSSTKVYGDLEVTGSIKNTTIPITGTAPIVSSGGSTPAISINAATTSLPGSMSAADKTKLDGINRVQDVDATGLPSITIDAVNYDIINISNITSGDYIQLGSIPIGKTAMIVINSPGAISILFNETVLWPNGVAPVHGNGWEVMVFTRIAAGVVLGSATLAHA